MKAIILSGLLLASAAHAEAESECVKTLGLIRAEVEKLLASCVEGYCIGMCQKGVKCGQLARGVDCFAECHRGVIDPKPKSLGECLTLFTAMSAQLCEDLRNGQVQGPAAKKSSGR